MRQNRMAAILGNGSEFQSDTRVSGDMAAQIRRPWPRKSSGIAAKMIARQWRIAAQIRRPWPRKSSAPLRTGGCIELN
jgi:hypothetical protein